MEWNKWYIVEVSHFIGNPKHRAICLCVHDKKGEELVEFVTYEDKQRKSIKGLHHFEIVKEIKEMNI